ncbi:MAG: SPJ_0845 family protein [Liquorilactobacillus ghanensis]|jgi:hypothetical protein
MGLTINRQNQLDQLFDKFAADPLKPTAKKEETEKDTKKTTKDKK